MKVVLRGNSVAKMVTFDKFKRSQVNNYCVTSGFREKNQDKPKLSDINN